MTITTLRVAIAALLMAMGAGMADASVASRTANLSRRLNNLPLANSPALAVKRLIVALTELDPEKAAKYFKTGYKRLSPFSPTAHVAQHWLAINVLRIVKKAALTNRQKVRISSQIDKILEPGIPPYEPYPDYIPPK